jgi:hypothetical protein
MRRIIHRVGGEPSHSHGGYPQQPPSIGFLNSQYTRSCKENTRHVLQGAKGIQGLSEEAKVDQCHEGLRHRVGGGQNLEVACRPSTGGSHTLMTHNSTPLAC